MISTIYKFRNVNIHNITALSSCNLWFSALPDFNDAFEGEYIIDESLSKSDKEFLQKRTAEICSYVDPDSNDYYSVLEKFGINPESENLLIELGIAFAKDEINGLLKLLHNSKCISFSAKTKDCDPLYENLLWSHYSDGLRGYCLVFNNNKLRKHFYESIDDAIRPISVSYQRTPKSLPISNYIKSKSFHNKNDTTYIQPLTETMATKSSSWSYENELRYIAFEGQNIYHYPPDCLKKIIIGEKMPNDEVKLITKIAKSVNPDICIEFATIEKNTYSIQIVEKL